MPYHGAFSYKNDKNRIIEIDKTIRIKIDKLDQHIARICFVNEKDISIKVPDGIVVKDLSTNTNVPRVELNGTESYSI